MSSPLNVANITLLRLSTFPPQLFDLTGLVSLGLSSNGLNAVPSNISKLSALRYLNLSNNALTFLPSSIGHLKHLTQLDLNNNMLTSPLPEQLGALTCLSGLRLNDNQLTSLPSSLGSLTLLHSLYIGNNELRCLPPTFRHLVALVDLRPEGNPPDFCLCAELLMLPKLRKIEGVDCHLELGHARKQFSHHPIVFYRMLSLKDICGQYLLANPAVLKQKQNKQKFQLLPEELKELFTPAGATLKCTGCERGVFGSAGVFVRGDGTLGGYQLDALPLCSRNCVRSLSSTLELLEQLGHLKDALPFIGDLRLA